MNTSLPEMLSCLAAAGNFSDMTVLERQRARMKWQQLQDQDHQIQEQGCFSMDDFSNVFSFQSLITGGLPPLGAVKEDPGLENGWPEFGNFPAGFGGGGGGGGGNSSGFHNSCGIEVNYGISRTISCPPMVVEAATTEAVAVAVPDSCLREKLNSSVGRESFKKRKAEKTQNSEGTGEDEISREKKIKAGVEEGESKITELNTNKNNRETSTDTSKDNSKVSEVQKPDYIHVRARRGQATDSHSLAERVRREKISERMKYLQDLVPGCNKITGKAGMLDEIINYVQSLQRQVEFLSMKLAAVNPRLDFDIDNFFSKEVFQGCVANFSTVGMSSEMGNNPAAYLQYNAAAEQQLVSCCGLEMEINPTEMGLRRSISAPIAIQPETFLDSACFNQIQQTSSWDADLQNLLTAEYNQGRSTFLQSQPLTGSIEVSNLKMEM